MNTNMTGLSYFKNLCTTDESGLIELEGLSVGSCLLYICTYLKLSSFHKFSKCLLKVFFYEVSTLRYITLQSCISDPLEIIHLDF